MSRLNDREAMALCLRLARRGAGKASPNPMVGAVVADDRGTAGTGWYRGPGTPHAETIALDEAGERARGATLYVSLEPCAHHGKTPPCVDAVISSGVGRVVVAMADPDSRVSGRGSDALRRAGIEVEEGLMEDRARLLNEAYVTHRTENRPFVTYKAALSLDGRTAASDGSSKWITSEPARRDVQRLRARSDAVAVGIGTVLADDPLLTVRGRRTRPPLRVVLDSHARTPLLARVLTSEAPALVITGVRAPRERVLGLQGAGAEVVTVPEEEGRVSLKHALEALAGRRITSLLLEGGRTLAGAFASAGFIDRYVLYLAPKLVGGPAGLVEWAAGSLGLAKALEITSVRRIGPDLRVTAREI
ncbi:MAG: bifunctional diaminohydroxyphosphoribosylaminopyrimidine deaminase/5-amino-6-(5-phosphoribosylamino)uracil reductase RibD [Actinomycetota bacterium]